MKKPRLHSGKPVNAEERKLTQYDIDRLKLSKKLSGGKISAIVGKPIKEETGIIYSDNGEVQYWNGQKYDKYIRNIERETKKNIKKSNPELYQQLFKNKN